MPKPLKRTLDTRHEARKLALQALFEGSFHKTNLQEAAARIQEDLLISAVDQDLLSTLLCGVEEHVEQIDTLIARCAPEWPFDQLPKLDLNILRIAIFELYVDQSVPPKVAIDEAVELAKEYGTESTSSFVNGALGTVSKLRDKQLDSEAALFIGHFQPPHKGHQQAIRQITSRFPKLLIGILGAEHKNTFEHPLSIKERHELLTDMLSEMSFKLDERDASTPEPKVETSLVDLPDPRHCGGLEWIDALKKLKLSFAAIYTNNTQIAELCRAADYPVFETQLVNTDEYNAEAIKQSIVLGQPWSRSVPVKTERYLRRRKVVERIRNLAVAR